MGSWPATMFSKLPYLELEGKEYLGNNMKVSFAAVGDAYSDSYPLQVRKFTSGRGLERSLKELVIEGRGGNGFRETYELCALYYAKNANIPKAIKPVFVFIGDEATYDFVDKDSAKKLMGINLRKKLKTKDVMDELKNKYSVYLIRKPYDSSRVNNLNSINQNIHAQWESYLGEDHIAMLPGADRVVDVLFGILAKETDRISYFEEELKGRQTAEQVETVTQSLHSIHNPPTKKPVIEEESDGSITKIRNKGKLARALFTVE
jgi:hypothetical protein